jgi:hypothetical protein
VVFKAPEKNQTSKLPVLILVAAFIAGRQKYPQISTDLGKFSKTTYLTRAYVGLVTAPLLTYWP